MKMKKQLLTIATLACFTLAGTPAVAKPGHNENPMRQFAKLDLSSEQKQEMKAIFKATRENNSVYIGEKKEIQNQMQDLMKMPAWDQANAETIIRSQFQQSTAISLNRAKARSEVYNLLNDEQKTTLALREDKKSTHKRLRKADQKKDKKSKRKGKGQKMKLDRITKALSLSDEQVEQFKTIEANAKQQMIALKAQSKTTRDSMKTIIQSPSFDENAWLENENNALDTKVNARLIKTKAHYDRISLLNDEQKQQFSKIMKKMKEKRAKSGYMR
jgi:Spy/CpxP family protein refolding chaperone